MIKDKNIDPSANFPNVMIDLHNCGAITTTNGTTVIDAWVAPWAGRIVSCSLFQGAATVTTYKLDVLIGTATNSPSIFAAAVTMTAALTPVNAFSQISTTSFAAGDILTLRVAGTQTKPQAMIGVRPLLAKEISGY